MKKMYWSDELFQMVKENYFLKWFFLKIKRMSLWIGPTLPTLSLKYAYYNKEQNDTLLEIRLKTDVIFTVTDALLYWLLVMSKLMSTLFTNKSLKPSNSTPDFI